MWKRQQEHLRLIYDLPQAFPGPRGNDRTRVLHLVSALLHHKVDPRLSRSTAHTGLGWQRLQNLFAVLRVMSRYGLINAGGDRFWLSENLLPGLRARGVGMCSLIPPEWIAGVHEINIDRRNRRNMCSRVSRGCGLLWHMRPLGMLPDMADSRGRIEVHLSIKL
jgi:hypothetical protein